MSQFQKLKVIRSNRRSIALQILPDSTLVVRSPFFLPQREIDKFIEKNSDWIKNRLSVFQNKKQQVRLFEDGEEFLYLGVTRKLKIGNFQSISVSEDLLLFPKFLVFRIQKELEGWYINKAKEYIRNQLDIHAQQMKTSYNALAFSDTRSKWGSCTHDNRLQFSWRLIMAPEIVIRYVIVHELAHTLEKNHSRSFWSKVRAINPSYKQQIKWLKENGQKLFI